MPQLQTALFREESSRLLESLAHLSFRLAQRLPLHPSGGEPFGCNFDLSKFVDHHSKILINNIPSFIQDSPDFLRTLDTLNQSNQISDTDILVTIDVSSPP